MHQKGVQMFLLYCDGACSGNPGPMKLSFALYHDDELLTSMHHTPAGDGTNNLAEYYALILGMEVAKVWVPEDWCVQVHTDSELVFRQIKGEYQVLEPKLKEPHKRAKRILYEQAWVLHWVPRNDLNFWLDRAVP